MSKVIGIVSEGPTDYLVLKTVIDKITGIEKPKTDTISIVATGHFQGDKEAMRLESNIKLQ